MLRFISRHFAPETSTAALESMLLAMQMVFIESLTMRFLRMSKRFNFDTSFILVSFTNKSSSGTANHHFQTRLTRLYGTCSFPTPEWMLHWGRMFHQVTILGRYSVLPSEAKRGKHFRRGVRLSSASNVCNKTSNARHSLQRPKSQGGAKTYQIREQTVKCGFEPGK